jgi:hypothetical protein
LSIIYAALCIRGILTFDAGKPVALDSPAKLMESIKLLSAHSDRRVSNQIEVAILDVCYNQAVVNSTRISRLDEFVHQGGLWDFDLMVVGADHLFADKTQKNWAATQAVADAIEQVRQHRSTPIIALAASQGVADALLQAGADVVLSTPFNADQFKAEVRSLLELSSAVEPVSSSGWSAFGSLLRGFQKAKA